MPDFLVCPKMSFKSPLCAPVSVFCHPCYWDLFSFFSYRTSVCGAICVSCLLSFRCTLSKHLALHPLYALFSFFLTLLFLSEQTQLSHLSCYAMHSTPLTVNWGLIQCVHFFLKLRRPQLDRAPQMCFTRAEKTGVSPHSICQLFFWQHSSGCGLLSLLPEKLL